MKWADLPYANQGIGRVVVVFSEQNRIKYLRLLKPGFRHCFAYGLSRAGWIALDPLSQRLVLDLVDFPSQADLAAAFRRAGWMALTVEARMPPERPAPPVAFTCVEVVKRLIGLQDYTIRTPWKLFCYLREFSLDEGIRSNYKSTYQEQNLSSRLQAGGRQPWRINNSRLRAWHERWRQIMGGIFSSPSPPAPIPAAPVVQPEDPNEEAQRIARERRRRAQGETIATSYRGVSGSNNGGSAEARKTLLGE